MELQELQRHEPEIYLVQFYKVEPFERVGVIEVRCFELDESRTRVQVTYEYIGLSEAGDRFVSGFTSSDYSAFMAEWKTLLVKYFETKR